jgi:transposase
VGAGYLSPHPKKGLRIGACLGFLDEAGFSDRPNVRKTWARKGKTPIIVSAGGWKNRSVIATIVTDPEAKALPAIFVMIRPTAVKSPDIITYIKQLKRHLRGKKLILLWDGLAAHRSKMTRTFIDTQAAWLMVERMPTYAPELNPPEYAWSSLKAKDMANACSASLSELDRRIQRGIRRLKRSPTIIQGCLKASGLFG